MNIKIADRLIELRKERNLSQEQLAEKLGVSRQAISKWERAEASPDTDNLIALANLYEISLDELLLNKVNKEETTNDESNKDTGDKPSGIHIKDGNKQIDIGLKGIQVVKGDKEVIVNGRSYSKYVRRNPTSIIIENVFVILIITAYLLLGFLTKRGWAVGWVLFLLIPVAESIDECFKTKLVSRFNFASLVINIYCFIGMMWGIWHPSWVVFLLIPIFYIIAAAIDRKRGAFNFEFHGNQESSEVDKKVDSEALDVDVEIHKDEEN